MDNNIYKLLCKKNMTQIDLAIKVGVKREYINRIIHRKIIPKVPMGVRIARALEVAVEDLFIVDH